MAKTWRQLAKISMENLKIFSESCDPSGKLASSAIEKRAIFGWL
jgi:hypothetical protein